MQERLNLLIHERPREACQICREKRMANFLSIFAGSAKVWIEAFLRQQRIQDWIHPWPGEISPAGCFHRSLETLLPRGERYAPIAGREAGIIIVWQCRFDSLAAAEKALKQIDASAEDTELAAKQHPMFQVRCKEWSGPLEERLLPSRAETTFPLPVLRIAQILL